MKSLYEGILNDIDTVINNSDDTIKIYSIFDKVINSNKDNFEKHFDSEKYGYLIENGISDYAVIYNVGTTILIYNKKGDSCHA